MSIYPLDAVRNATIDQEVEQALEDLRQELAAFSPADRDAVLEVFDLVRPRLNVLVAQLRDQEGKTGADIGAGFGFLPVLLSRYGITTIASEADVETSRFAASQGVEVRQYCIGKAPPPFSPSSLDFVVFAEVLEHLKLCPVPVVQELAGLLRPGGRFILTTPNIARMQHLEALLAGENFLEPYPEHVPPGDDPTDYIEHVREYSVREIVEAAEAAGLMIDRVLMTGWGEAGYDLLPNPYVNEISVLVATR